MSAFGEPSRSEIQLYPHESVDAKEVYLRLSKKYTFNDQMLNSRENLVAFENEAIQRFAEVGLEVIVDISNQVVDYSRNVLVLSPLIEIVGRIEKKAFDHDQMAHEVQAGISDGVVGTVGEDGNLHEPSKPVAVSQTPSKLWTPGKD